jgi:hypothetical protein
MGLAKSAGFTMYSVALGFSFAILFTFSWVKNSIKLCLISAVITGLHIQPHFSLES